MSLQVMADIDYTGSAGIQQIMDMQQALIAALAEQNWLEVRRLDQACAALVDKVIAANRANTQALLPALNTLKKVYLHMLSGCQQKVASMAV